MSQFANPAQPHLGIKRSWVFRFRLCRWHLAAWNRRQKRAGFKLFMAEKERTDAEVLAELGPQGT